jgi:hypothetical protein
MKLARLRDSAALQKRCETSAFQAMSLGKLMKDLTTFKSRTKYKFCETILFKAIM